MNKRMVAVSGGFDPVHVGHIKMIQEAARNASVLVIINSDEWLVRKKGYSFMSWDDRAYIMGNIKGVSVVTNVDDSDDTVCEALRRFKPTAFANGGDRKMENTPEMELCKELGIELMWNVGGGKIRSSSDIVRDAKSDTVEEENVVEF